MFEKGNKLGGGKKNRSGRKSKLEEIEKIKKWMGEKIEKETLLNLANSIGYLKLKEIIDKAETKGFIWPQEMKDIVMPIVLKGMGEKIIGDSLNPLIIKVAKDVIEKYDTNSEAGNNSEG